jgi:hypothetical protein
VQLSTCERIGQFEDKFYEIGLASGIRLREHAKKMRLDSCRRNSERLGNFRNTANIDNGKQYSHLHWRQVVARCDELAGNRSLRFRSMNKQGSDGLARRAGTPSFAGPEREQMANVPFAVV